LGTGKSHLASCIIRAAIEAGRSAAYLTVTDLVIEVRSTYCSGSKVSLKNILEAWIGVDLLVLDEVGQAVGSEDGWLLFHVLDTRYRRQRPTVIISNLDPERLERCLGPRCMDRLREGGMVVPFTWSSWRCR
ncbi:MAG: ATP-binding protein, partial [Magnetococcales bacterium]|nr:ATP-binding protein [Magnetococcales bacterium]